MNPILNDLNGVEKCLRYHADEIAASAVPPEVLAGSVEQEVGSWSSR